MRLFWDFGFSWKVWMLGVGVRRCDCSPICDTRMVLFALGPLAVQLTIGRPPQEPPVFTVASAPTPRRPMFEPSNN